MRWVMIVSGLLLALAASALLLFGVINSGLATAIGILGIRADRDFRPLEGREEAITCVKFRGS